MMGVNDVGARHRGEQTRRNWMGRVTAQPGQRAQRAAHQPTWFTLEVRRPTEAEQLALDVPGQRARQLERVAFAAAE